MRNLLATCAATIGLSVSPVAAEIQMCNLGPNADSQQFSERMPIAMALQLEQNSLTPNKDYLEDLRHSQKIGRKIVWLVFAGKDPTCYCFEPPSWSTQSPRIALNRSGDPATKTH